VADDVGEAGNNAGHLVAVEGALRMEAQTAAVRHILDRNAAAREIIGAHCALNRLCLGEDPRGIIECARGVLLVRILARAINAGGERKRAIEHVNCFTKRQPVNVLDQPDRVIAAFGPTTKPTSFAGIDLKSIFAAVYRTRADQLVTALLEGKAATLSQDCKIDGVGLGDAIGRDLAAGG